MKSFYKRNNLLIAIGLSLLWLSGCSGGKKGKKNRNAAKIVRDLPQIKEEGVLNVITLYNSTSYFLYRGLPMGYEYEMAAHLAGSLGLKMNIVVAKSFNDVFKLLNSGAGDIIAFGLTITKARKEHIAFTHYLYLTRQVLVQRKPKNWRSLPAYKIRNRLIRDPYKLIGDTLYVGKGTSYYPRLMNLAKEIGGDIYVNQVVGDTTTDDIINMVAEGKIKYTVADYNLASVNQYYHPILDIGTDLSLSQRIAWAVRKNSPELLQAVNTWIGKAKKKHFYHALYKKYFKNKRSYRARMSSDLFSKYSGKISPYDSIIRKYATIMGWDWRLLCAQIYQESQFNAGSTGRLGAGGLMQLMPETAQELGITNLYNPAANIKGGTAYLKRIYNRFDKITDSIQRIKFSLAAYNAGVGHILDAQRLAKALGDDPHLWDDNVEEALLKLRKHKYFSRPEVRHGLVRGMVPYNYVRDIFHRYKQYKKLILLNPKEGMSANAVN